MAAKKATKQAKLHKQISTQLDIIDKIAEKSEYPEQQEKFELGLTLKQLYFTQLALSFSEQSTKMTQTELIQTLTEVAAAMIDYDEGKPRSKSEPSLKEQEDVQEVVDELAAYLSKTFTDNQIDTATEDALQKLFDTRLEALDAVGVVEKNKVEKLLN